MKRLTGILILALFVLLANAKCASASTYYVSVSSGSDSNSSSAAQSKNSPWAHLPGMANCTGNCASYTPQPGDSFILKGCDDWPNASFPVKWTWSGTSGSHITIGVDQSWYNTSACSTWNRPKFDAGGAAMGGTECTGSGANGNFNIFLYFPSGGNYYVDLDWIEEIGYHWTWGEQSPCYGQEEFNKGNGGDHITFTNFYVHKWSSPSAKNDTQLWTGNGAIHIQWDHLVLDNSDGDKVAGANVDAPTTNSVIQYVANAFRIDIQGVYANNNVSHILSGLPGEHSNLLETLPPPGGTTFYFYNNVFHDTGNAGVVSTMGNPGETDYMWNNVMWNLNSTPTGGPQASSSTAYYLWNNTFVAPGGICIGVGVPGAWSTAFVAENNLCITTFTSDISVLQTNPTTANTITIQNNLLETISQAAAQGMSSSTSQAYSPQSSNCNGISANCPIGTGVNLMSQAEGLVSSLGLDTTFACAEQTINGVIQSVCPVREAVNRPGSGAWDVGAYQFGTSNSPSAPSGLSATVQ